MKYSEKLMKAAVLTLTILGLGLTNISTATAQTRTDPVTVERSTAEACKAKVEQFDSLLSEAEILRRQRDEAVGSSMELRFLYFDVMAEVQDWKMIAKTAQDRADNAPSRLTWFIVGGSAGVVVTAVTFFLLSDF